MESTWTPKNRRKLIFLSNINNTTPVINIDHQEGDLTFSANISVDEFSNLATNTLLLLGCNHCSNSHEASMSNIQANVLHKQLVELGVKKPSEAIHENYELDDFQLQQLFDEYNSKYDRVSLNWDGIEITTSIANLIFDKLLIAFANFGYTIEDALKTQNEKIFEFENFDTGGVMQSTLEAIGEYTVEDGWGLDLLNYISPTIK